MAKRPKAETEETSLAQTVADLGERRIAELKTALRPFAEHAKRLRKADRKGGARKPIYEMADHTLTLGDFDAASAAMEADNGV